MKSVFILGNNKKNFICSFASEFFIVVAQLANKNENNLMEIIILIAQNQKGRLEMNENVNINFKCFCIRGFDVVHIEV